MVFDAVLWQRRHSALQFAISEHLHGSPCWFDLCQKFVRTACGAGPGALTAHLAWQELSAADRHGVGGKHPPAGVPAFFRIGSAWHVALSAGHGLVWSTDILRHGHVDKVSIPFIETHWNAPYVGWGSSSNGRRMWPA